MATNNKYKSAKTIEQEAKELGMQFVVSNINFNDPKQRAITVADHDEITRKQQEMINGGFENFLEKLYDATITPELNYDVLTYLENAYYNKPTYSLAIASGADINLDKLAQCLIAARGDATKQKFIADQFNGQLKVAALKGMVRDYYTNLLVIQDGYEGKASRSFMGTVNTVLDNSLFCVGVEFDDQKYNELLGTLKTDIQRIRGNKTLSFAEEVTKQSNKALGSFLAVYSASNLKR